MWQLVFPPYSCCYGLERNCVGRLMLAFFKPKQDSLSEKWYYLLIIRLHPRGIKMIHIQNKSDTLLLVLHEIYGINQHMRSFCELLSKQNMDVICPNLGERAATFDYSDEDAAYRHFMDNIGFAYSAQKIKDLLTDVKEGYDKIFIIGFSVGATVAWLCCGDEYVDGIVGYYGSRIRDYTNLTPQCPAMLFFPESEQAFNVDELIATLEKKKIEIHKLKGKHGFSDPYSSSYHAESEQEAVNRLMEFLRSNADKQT
jgi:dienelactone hydrolase